MAKKSKTPKIKRRCHVFKLDIYGSKLNVALPWVPARSVVQILRSRKDVLEGIRGNSMACADAKCAESFAHEFPHAVYHSDFGERFAYFIDKKDKRGHPVRCVKYIHDDGPFIRAFDEHGKDALLERDDVERIITLRPPPKRGSQAGQQRPKGKNDGSRSRRKQVGRGAERRALAALGVKL